MRTLVNYGFTAETDLDLTNFATDISAWFAAQPSLGEETWLLAYAEDGVIWGKLNDGKLLLPKTAPTLAPQTLLEARLFGDKGEIHLWRSDDGFSACRVTDEPGKTHGAFDEWQRLWGTEVDNDGKPGDGFTLLTNGRIGLRHAVPLTIPSTHFARRQPSFQPAVIQTRHYFQVDPVTGVTTIALSRLVSVMAESFEEYRKRVNDHE